MPPLTITDTTPDDTITVTDGSPQPPFQTADVDGATLHVEFTNDDPVTIDGSNGGDTVVFDDPDTASGLTTLTVQNLGTGSTITGGTPNTNSPDIAVANLTLNADVGIGTANRPLRTQVSTLNATLTNSEYNYHFGSIYIDNGVAAPTTLTITGNGSPQSGLATTADGGDLSLINNGTIDRASEDNGVIVGFRNITVEALGANADIGDQSSGMYVGTFPSTQTINLEAGRDINLGATQGVGGVFGQKITLTAGRNIFLTQVEAFGNGAVTVTAGGDITMPTGANLNLFAGDGAVAMTTGAGSTLTLGAFGGNAINADGGNISLTADTMNIAAGIDAGAGDVLLQPVTAGRTIGLGTGAGGLQLSEAALNEVTTTTLTIGNANAGAVTLGGEVIFAPHGYIAGPTNLKIVTGGGFSAGAGTTLIVPGMLTIDFDASGQGATADLSGAIDAASLVVDSGTGNDTFITADISETINGGGGVDTAVFSGAMAQYTINQSNGVTTVTGGGVTDTLTGVRFLQFSDQAVTVQAPGTPPTATADLVLRESQGAGAGELLALNVLNTGGNPGLSANTPGNIELNCDTLGNIGLNWQVFGTGSFAGNPNEADLFMRDGVTGNLQIFDIVSGELGAGGVIGAVGADWQGFGVGDFSGNAGESDAVIHSDSTGALYLLDIQHNQLVGQGSLGAVGAEWQLLGVGDFSGNPGESDIAMRDGNTGAIDLLDIQDNQLVAPPISIGGIGLEWQALGVGDFSGNANETDLLMHDTQTGAIVVFDIQHNQIVGSSSPGGIGPEWQALGIGDFSGNPGEADLAMRDTQNGSIMVFEIRHNQLAGNPINVGSAGAEWQNLGVGSPLVPGSPLV